MTVEPVLAEFTAVGNPARVKTYQKAAETEPYAPEWIAVANNNRQRRAARGRKEKGNAN